MKKCWDLEFIDKMKTAKFKCPKCGFIEKIEIPKERCLIFYKCKNCGELISTPENFCCIVCAYSDKKCDVFQSKR